jgi:hypothetical protein
LFFFSFFHTRSFCLFAPTLFISDNNDDNNEHIKRKHRVTSEIEKEILNPLLLFETFPEHLINNVINQLESKDCTDWDLSRIKKFWFNNNLFKKSKKQN